MYKMQMAERKIQKELNEIEKKKLEIEGKIEKTSIIREKLSGEIEKLNENKIKLEKEYEKELNKIADNIIINVFIRIWEAKYKRTPIALYLFGAGCGVLFTFHD